MELILGILTIFLLGTTLVDTLIRPWTATVAEVDSSGMSTAIMDIQACPSTNPCLRGLYQVKEDSCLMVQLAPGSDCTSPCQKANSSSACTADAQCRPLWPNGSRGYCQQASDCFPLVDQSQAECILNRCQWHLLQPFIGTNLSLVDKENPSCSMFVNEENKDCLKESSWMVPMRLTQHKDPLVQYRLRQFVFIE